MMIKMSATQILRDDHKGLRGLFRQLEAVDRRGDGVNRFDVVREVLDKIQVHSRMEEEIFYPALLELLDTNSRALVQECIQDHTDVDRLVTELKSVSLAAGTGGHVPPQFDELIESVEAHLQKEENDLFSVVERELAADRLIEVGARLQALQTQLVQKPEYQANLQAAQNPNGGEQMRIQ